MGREPMAGDPGRVAAGSQGRQPEEQENHAPGDAGNPKINGPVEQRGSVRLPESRETSAVRGAPSAPATVSRAMDGAVRPGQDDRDPAADPDVPAVLGRPCPSPRPSAPTARRTRRRAGRAAPRPRPPDTAPAACNAATDLTASKAARPGLRSSAVAPRSTSATGV